MIENIAAGFLVVSFFALAIFQAAIVLGAPLGEYSYGGANKGVLPRNYRVSSVFSALFALAVSGHYLSQLGLIPQLLASDANSIANWVLVGFAILATIVNNISRSKKERLIWGPTTFLMLIASVTVAL
jgi:hypothetical protein